ncbi:RagB/SusD family nutrient uptake outer membrane protein [Dysgonomonas gadei]|uniref:RagB/SusD domain-containing protein n=1 Tax=Dysgonomonas gadei ATCC BAA-286 TaxID=742766 RepID=F5IWJ6_9BACT|nr:RagB/SusD family nutrient uptake outer membrane protein [Dysgonomonas gadei]EGK02506.1 hypothetical protein HMPREF9455_01463 [Dysgonomonas gadei ATCC BAA-286]
MKHIFSKKGKYTMQRICTWGLGALLLALPSCGEDFLTVYPTNQVAAGAPATKDVIEQMLTSSYQILLMDNYANGSIASVTIFGDFRSDDIYKGGGDATDQPPYYYMSQYKSTSVDIPTGWWSIYYTGLQRCNSTLQACDNAISGSAAEINRLKAEARTLRAYYVHLLWKAWGNIPYYDVPLAPPYLAPQLSADDVYQKIIADLDAAINTEELPMNTTGANASRINKAMAMMTKARVVMYQKDQTKYAQVLEDMKKIIGSGEFDLIKKSPDTKLTDNPIEWMFLREGEFCKESIFESNQLSEGKTWGNSWAGYGTYLPRVISARSLKDSKGMFAFGWGWCPVQPDAYAVFNEAGDYRKDASVIQWPSGTYEAGYQNTGLFLRKYTARVGYNQNTTGDADLNFDNNTRIYRLAETYLNAAELSFYAGGEGAAKPYLDAIRDRAFGDVNHRIPATLNNIKLERRRELFGEGSRFWDLVRWGSDEKGRDIKTVLSVTDDTYKMNRTWDDTKKYLPLPKNEIDVTKGTEFEIKQNPGWE